MILEIILGVAALFALYWSFRYWKLIPALITYGMILGIVLVIWPQLTSKLTGIYLYMGFVAIAFVYGLAVKGKSYWSRIIICIMSAGIFLYWIWVLNHWHGNALIGAFVTVVMGLIGIISWPKLRKELAFLVILFADAAVILLEHYIKMK